LNSPERTRQPRDHYNQLDWRGAGVLCNFIRAARVESNRAAPSIPALDSCRIFMKEQINYLAQRLVSTLSDKLGVHLKYDRASVEWLDGYVGRIRPHLDESSVDGRTSSIG
jgi:hypothetical protein